MSANHSKNQNSVIADFNSQRDSKNIELVVKLEPIPPQEKYVETSELAKKIDVFPVDLYMCLDCGHVQQLDIC